MHTLLKKIMRPALLASVVATASVHADVFISELHYDNAGTDTGEAIELTGPHSTDLTGWSLVLYNGTESRRSPYATITLFGALDSASACDGIGQMVIEHSGIQNGAPDGLALVDSNGNVVEFLSYEGAFTAAAGPATGLISTDIGVRETGSTPEGYSLQRESATGAWAAPAANTFGSCIGEQAPEEPTFTKIHKIQGSGNEVAMESEVTVEAIVTADFQNADQLRGFFIQEEDADADNNPQTSEGIFVFCNSCATDVAVGDMVRVTGSPSDYYDMSQINATAASDISVVSNNNTLPSAASIQLPVPVTENTIEDAQAQINQFYEAVEGMIVTINGESVASEYYQLGRYGQIVMAHQERFRQFTDVSAPDAEAYVQHQIDMASRRFILDDGSSVQNPATVVHPQPQLTRTHYFRGGDSITNLTGVLHYSFSEWRVQPVFSAFDYSFNQNNPRASEPQDVGGNLQVASFNVLNYFTTLDQGADICGPEQTMECRGADSEAELSRQQDKIVSALCALEADIIGLMEIQNPALNHSGEAPVETLVNAVNEACGGYAPLLTGTVGTDAIAVGLMYKPQSVQPAGITAVLDSTEFTDPLNTGVPKNRAALAQTFLHTASQEHITVAVNHLKSKGSSCGAGDDDTGTGQGNCNGTRTAAAMVQADWLATAPTGVDTPYQLIIGDLNAYRKEDPITVFKEAGFTDLIDTLSGPAAYGYVFDGQTGYLDHALASSALVPFVTGVTDWHINADEINLFDYNSEYKPANYEDLLFSADAYRSSDHDPVLVGIALPEIPRCNGKPATIYVDDNNIVVGGSQDGQTFYGTLFGTDGDDVMVASAGNDVLMPRSGDDTLCAEGGDDTVIAIVGNNTVYGGSGNDFLLGGSGMDALYGGPGRDNLNAGLNDDILVGGPGSDMLFGGPGADQCLEGELNFSCE